MTSLHLERITANQAVGEVSRVSLSWLEIELIASSREGSRTNAGVKDYVLVHCNQGLLFGQIVDLYTADTGSNGSRSSTPHAKVELLSTLDFSGEKITPGVTETPAIGDRAYLAWGEVIKTILQSHYEGKEGASAVQLSIATLRGEENTAVNFAPERMFGRHCAVLGTTGSGKSWSLARMIEECARFKSKVVLIDATGEFRGLQEGVRHIHFGKDPESEGYSQEVVLPYRNLTEGDLFAIFRPRGESQAPKLRAAMRSLKLARMAPDIAPEGTIIKAFKSKIHYEQEYGRHIKKVETPYADFKIRYLPQQIENECVDPQRSSVEPHYWGGVNGYELSNCAPLISRIQDIIQSPNLSPIFHIRNKLSLIKELHDFIKSDEHQILRISLQFLSFAHHAREIVANAIGRHLLQLARDGVFLERPMLIVVDEAHQFLNTSVSGEDSEYPLDSFGLIAKEGRKYSTNICIATQRPRDIPEGVLSQMGTLIVHRLINDRDRHVIERASGEVDTAAINALPALAPGEALLLGVDFPVPVGIRVIAPHVKPFSRGPDFQQFWIPKAQKVRVRE